MMSNRAEWMEAGAVALAAVAAVALVVFEMFGQHAAKLVFRFGFLLTAFAVPTWFGFRALEDARHRSELRRRELSRLDREIERLRSITLESGGNFLSVDSATGTAEAHFRPTSPRRVTINQAGGPSIGPGIDTPRLQALPLLADADCGLVAGGRGAGKTELARWAMAEKARAGWRVVALDPKPAVPGKWPGCRVIGMDHDYAGIRAALDAVTANLRDGGHRLVVLIDELPLLNLHIRGFSDLWLPILLEGREYGVHCWLIAQSKTAGSIGLSGRYDLMECFDLLVLAKKDRAGNRWIEIEDDSGSAPIVAEHPGPFHGISPAGAYQRHGSDIPDAEWTEPPGMDTDAPEPGGAVRRVAGLIDFVRLSGPARRVLAYIERNGGSVNRGKLLASRCIGKRAKAPDYDTALEALETAGRIAVDRSGPMAKWTYRV